MELDIIEIVSEFKHLQIREKTDDGTYHRRLVSSDMTLADDEYQAVKDKATEVWTDEVKEAWTKHQAKSSVE